MYVVWPAIFIVLVVIEVETLQLVSIWFAAGALASTIVVMCNGPLWLQFVVFFAVAIILLIATRPIVRKALKMAPQATNAELDIGKTALVIESVDTDMGTGRARLNGVDWIAVSESDKVIPEGSLVEIININGAKLIVREKKEESAKV